MLYQDIILREMAQLPSYQQRELLDFLLFLKQKEKKSLLGAEKMTHAAKPGFGCGSVKVRMAEDFDAPLDDFKEYMI
jgi:hypothetical protein